MPSRNQISYLFGLRELIAEPILIIGAREYDFDEESFLPHLRSWGFNLITGIDLTPGPGVDQVVDICESDSRFINNAEGSFQTVICMQVLYAADNPFIAAKNIERLLAPNGYLIFSDVFSHKIHRIPNDYWRFSYDGHKMLFKSLAFNDANVRVSITRSEKLLPLQYPLPEVLAYSQHPDETQAGFFFRRLHRKFLAKGIFSISRFLPELSIFSVAVKNGSATATQPTVHA